MAGEGGVVFIRHAQAEIENLGQVKRQKRGFLFLLCLFLLLYFSHELHGY